MAIASKTTKAKGYGNTRSRKKVMKLGDSRSGYADTKQITGSTKVVDWVNKNIVARKTQLEYGFVKRGQDSKTSSFSWGRGTGSLVYKDPYNGKYPKAVRVNLGRKGWYEGPDSDRATHGFRTSQKFFRKMMK